MVQAKNESEESVTIEHDLISERRKPARRITLARVADEAGVSIATASKVVNGRTGVGESTRRDIERVVEELGYVGVSERERPVRGLREPLVEIVIDSLKNPYALALLSGAIAAAESAKAAVVTRRLGALATESPMKWAQRLARTGRVGVIEVTSEFSAEREAALRSVGLPVVLVDPIDVPRTATVSVGATNWAGGMEATQHLIDLGHENIAYIGGPTGAACDVARTHGYQAAMHQAGLPTNLAEIIHGPFTFEQGLEAGITILARPHRPTAIFAASDVAALGVMEAARRLGIAIPTQLSVVGFDNTMLAPSSAPPLTTIHQPVEEIGATAVATIFRLASGETQPTKRVELATHLVVRDSTAPPPRHSETSIHHR
ncbi:LacI family transcriptional regulator [Subtercola vilae]|uniref:LacI family transcriptional regulator n=2 Tax=Subtercola vilae TaxID=2056433 RepID=A0A4T2BPF3_9MICO|nr:LacI family transcriptional regulator [Subtercola vilae]